MTYLVVLLVEDNPINQKVACAVLQKMGWTVEVANDGVEAVQMAERGDYAVVLMDLQMPNMDGFEATVQIRQRLGYALPIVALSASALPKDVERCTEVGMNGHLSKPIDRLALADMLDAAISAAAHALA